MIYDHEILQQEDVFDPKIHLAYVPPRKRFTMADLKLNPSETSSEIAATVPFPILSREGVRAYRRSLFRPSMIQRCACSPMPGTLILRNAAEHSRFINDFWTHPATIQLVSEAAGIPLSIVMRTEIGHTNIQTSGSTMDEMIAELNIEPDDTMIPLTEEEKSYDPLNTKSIIPWHYDSYPYVCVIMLSETESMVGGETYIKSGDGIPAKVEGPSIGHGVILQGGEVQHLAARGLGVKERISTITSYCANTPGLYDSSYISNIRPYSDIDVLYKQWALYRLQKMEQEMQTMQQQISQSGVSIDVHRFHRFTEGQMRYLKRTSRQLIPFKEYQAMLERYGKANIYMAPTLWKRAEQMPNFAELVALVNERSWMPESPFWHDLAHSQVDIRMGRTLQAQTGRYRWEKSRDFCMGDELLRQGLPEIFLSWLEATGLYSLVV